MATSKDAPPSYEAAVGSSSTSSTSNNAFLDPLRARNGIPPSTRRSMEDEARELPPGWIRQYDDKEHHQFFVDTTSDPPRSIWSHPYDDATYMNSLSAAERQRISALHRIPSEADIRAESSDEEEPSHYTNTSAAGRSGNAQLPPRPAAQPTGIHKLGRKMKDKVTQSTHEERERERQQRAEEERRAFERHQHIRQALRKAIETGQPQLIGKDKSGKDVYIEPPMQNNYYPGYGSPYGTGVYDTPNARYLRPQDPYNRPYGRGYGGGYGLPIAAGLGTGLLLGGGLLGGGLMGAGMF